MCEFLVKFYEESDVYFKNLLFFLKGLIVSGLVHCEVVSDYLKGTDWSLTELRVQKPYM